MSQQDLDVLYRDVILDHNRSPRHVDPLKEPDVKAEGFNPICGDRQHVELKLDEGKRICDICVHGQGCSISVASGSIMSEEVLGKSLEEASQFVEKVRDMMKGQDAVKSETGEVEALEGVKKFPVRIKCALLSWATLAQAIDQARTEKPDLKPVAKTE
jgi:nitrogen fixation NifU-like protein